MQCKTITLESSVTSITVIKDYVISLASNRLYLHSSDGVEITNVVLFDDINKFSSFMFAGSNNLIWCGFNNQISVFEIKENEFKNVTNWSVDDVITGLYESCFQEDKSISVIWVPLKNGKIKLFDQQSRHYINEIVLPYSNVFSSHFIEIPFESTLLYASSGTEKNIPVDYLSWFQDCSFYLDANA